MKKKIITVAIAASMLMTGVVSAASMWGSYKGNDVVRITANGSAIKAADVPAISYNGRTMIPINMLIQLGIPYTWDQANRTVDVQRNHETAEDIQNNVMYADFFHDVESLGESLSGLSNQYFTATNAITTNPKDSTLITKANESLNSLINFYNATKDEAKRYTDSDINGILMSYYNAIDYYKKMDNALNDFYSNRSNESLNAFNTNNTLGIKQSIQGTLAANKRYHYYIDTALSIK